MVGFCSLVAACLVGKILTAELLCHIYTCFYSRTFQYFLFSFFCLLCFVTNTCRLLCYMNFMENVAVRAVLLRARQNGFSAPSPTPNATKHPESNILIFRRPPSIYLPRFKLHHTVLLLASVLVPPPSVSVPPPRPSVLHPHLRWTYRRVLCLYRMRCPHSLQRMGSPLLMPTLTPHSAQR